MQKPALLFNRIVYRRTMSRGLTTLVLAVMLLAPLLAVSGCNDVEGAASNTAGQLNEREKRNKEASDIMDSAPKQHPQ